MDTMKKYLPVLLLSLLLFAGIAATGIEAAEAQWSTPVWTTGDSLYRDTPDTSATIRVDHIKSVTLEFMMANDKDTTAAAPGGKDSTKTFILSADFYNSEGELIRKYPNGGSVVVFSEFTGTKETWYWYALTDSIPKDAYKMKLIVTPSTFTADSLRTQWNLNVVRTFDAQSITRSTSNQDNDEIPRLETQAVRFRPGVPEPQTRMSMPPGTPVDLRRGGVRYPLRE